MTWQQFLTEKVLHEKLWPNKPERCVNCRGLDCDDCADNRTFDNRSDLMDLYAVIEKAGRWRNFEGETFDYWDEERIHDTTNSSFTAWLFCLDGEGYEDRCKMVSEFYGYKE